MTNADITHISKNVDYLIHVLQESQVVVAPYRRRGLVRPRGWAQSDIGIWFFVRNGLALTFVDYAP